MSTLAEERRSLKLAAVMEATTKRTISQKKCPPSALKLMLITIFERSGRP